MNNTPTSHDEIIREVLGRYGVFEAHRLVAQYSCYRNHPDGGIQELLVQVIDAGPEGPARFTWKVSIPDADNDAPLSANQGDTILDAGLNVHWRDLDHASRRAVL